MPDCTGGFSTIDPLVLWGETIRQENYGTPITRIMVHLKQHSPELHQEIVAGQV